MNSRHSLPVEDDCCVEPLAQHVFRKLLLGGHTFVRKYLLEKNFAKRETPLVDITGHMSLSYDHKTLGQIQLHYF